MRQRGFTFIEILVVMAISSVLLTGAVLSIQQILVTTGRVSSEMIGKAARMGIPVVVTQNSPTSLTIELASAWNMTLVGYARGRHMHVYTGWNRVKERET